MQTFPLSLVSPLFSSAAPASHSSLRPFVAPPSSVSPSILQRGTTCTNLPPGAGSFPRSPFSFVHKKNTGSSSLCFSFSFCFCCSGVSSRSALLAFFTVSGPLNKTSFYFIHKKETHTHTQTRQARMLVHQQALFFCHSPFFQMYFMATFLFSFLCPFLSSSLSPSPPNSIWIFSF